MADAAGGWHRGTRVQRWQRRRGRRYSAAATANACVGGIAVRCEGRGRWMDASGSNQRCMQVPQFTRTRTDVVFTTFVLQYFPEKRFKNETNHLKAVVQTVVYGRVYSTSFV